MKQYRPLVDDYSFSIKAQKDGSFVSTVKEIQGLRATGKTKASALSAIKRTVNHHMDVCEQVR